MERSSEGASGGTEKDPRERLGTDDSRGVSVCLRDLRVSSGGKKHGSCLHSGVLMEEGTRPI